MNKIKTYITHTHLQFFLMECGNKYKKTKIALLILFTNKEGTRLGQKKRR
jgi:hypothetical protein